MVTIPSVGETIERQVVETTHPDYMDRMRLLRFFREACDGTGGFAPYTNELRQYDSWPTDEMYGTAYQDTSRRTYLFRHPREGMKFLRRQMMAYHQGVTRKALDVVTGFLTKKDASYAEYPAQLADWMEGVNLRGNTWRILKSTQIVPKTLIYGELPVLLHYPPHDAVTRGQQIEMGADLIATVISPEVVVDWRENERGGYAWLKFVEEIDVTESPLSGGHRTITRYHYITEDGWWIVDDDGSSGSRDRMDRLPVVASGLWQNGVGMPVVRWRVNDGKSAVMHAAQMERELYNVTSMLQEIEREIVFPQRVLPDPGERLRAMIAAVDNVLWTDPESGIKPYILAPDVSAPKHYRERIAELKQQILEEFGLEFSEGAQTGVAQSFKMSKLTRYLVNLANDLEEAEYATHALAARMLGTELPLTSRAVWPTEFDARDVEKEIDALQAVIDADPGNTAVVECKMRMVTNVLPNLDEETKGEIRRELRDEVESEENADETADDQMEPRMDASAPGTRPEDTESR